MKAFIKLIVLGVVVVSLSVSCSKRPDQEISNVESAINTAVSEGADIYSKEDLEKLKSSFDAAMSEIDAQDKKLLKKYEQAKQMLVDVKTQADALTALIPVKKEAARKEAEKKEAIAILDEAKAAFEEAKSLLANAPAPTSKRIKTGIQALSAELSGLDASFAEIQPLVDTEDFVGAASKASILKEQIVAISTKIQQTINTVKK